MNRKFVLYIVLGLIVGAAAGASTGNGLLWIALGAVNGLVVGLFIATAARRNETGA